jgi:hypothetical protein
MTASLCVTAGSLRWLVVEGVVVLLGLVALLALRIMWAVRAESRRRRRLIRWAAREGYDLVRAERRWVMLALFLPSLRQIYDVEVDDADGTRRTGEALVGGYFYGSGHDRVRVRWDH